MSPVCGIDTIGGLVANRSRLGCTASWSPATANRRTVIPSAMTSLSTSLYLLAGERTVCQPSDTRRSFGTDGPKQTARGGWRGLSKAYVPTAGAVDYVQLAAPRRAQGLLPLPATFFSRGHDARLHQ